MENIRKKINTPGTYLAKIKVSDAVGNSVVVDVKIISKEDASFSSVITGDLDYYTNNLNDISRLSLNLTGYFWMVQPFGDGNTRTLRSFLYFIFSQLNYKLDLTFEPNDVPIIPIFYDEDEECVENDINNLIRRLTKKE